MFLSVFVALVVGGSAIASTASAANCASVSQGAIYYDGAFAFRASLSACTGVSGVEFAGIGGGPTTNGIVHEGVAWHYTSSFITGIYFIQPSYGFNYHVNVWGPGCNGTVMPVTSQWNYRIRNSFGNTWGAWHHSASGLQYIC